MRPGAAASVEDLPPVLDGLRAVAGLAPNEVLLNRLRRAAAAARRAAEAPPSPDDPHWAALLDAVTVQETRMFRAAAQVAAFRTIVLPHLPARPGALTLVSAGCATGEEAWTLALLADTAGRPWRVTGLDLCRPALAAAEEARYRLGPPDALREVPEADRGRLRLGGDWFEPDPALRPRVAFRRANLLKPDLPAGGADAVFCRNVLIYLTEEARGAVLGALVRALRPGGALVLGATDTPPPGLGLRAWPDAGIGIWRRADDDG